MVTTAASSDQTVDDAGMAAVAQDTHAAQSADHGGGFEIDRLPIHADGLEPVSNERASALAERNLMHRILIWTAIGVPVGATFFGLLVFVAAQLSDVPAGAPVAMGAAVGVLAGVFFGMWTGIVASVKETEHANLVLRQHPNV